MVYQDATGLYHFLINVIPFISNSALTIELFNLMALTDKQVN